MRRVLLMAVVLAAASYVVVANARSSAPESRQTTSGRWYRGNTHTHTLNSDGDSTPDDVVRWYREHRYDFLVLTDHNFLTDVTALNALHGADEKFLVIKGEELTSSFDRKPLHMNGLDVSRRVAPATQGTSVVDVLQQNVDAVRAANGIPQINHPNFGWGITTDELGAVRNTRLFEVYNGHPTVNNLGGSGRPSLEQMWDVLLTRGLLLYGLATDDAHHFKRPEDPAASRPGRGWVYVRAPRLEARAIVEALDRGEFYSSTGVELTRYEASAEQITLEVKTASSSGYRIQFIGKGGRLIEEVEGSSATYRVKGGEGYVRAKVIESNGAAAWTQPIMVR